MNPAQQLRLIFPGNLMLPNPWFIPFRLGVPCALLQKCNFACFVYFAVKNQSHPRHPWLRQKLEAAI
jgi:hypothetical protein